MIIDYSAYNAWCKCPAYWWEKYINKRQRRWPKALRNDALCLGGLVHAGLEVWQESHVVDIPVKAQDEYTPDRETFLLAQELVYGYARRYPQEIWSLGKCEEPVTWPLITSPAGNAFDDLVGLAKIDYYFYCPEPTVVDTGMPGQQMLLTPGFWIREYKTKGPYIKIGLYMQSWDMNMQATFQMLALRQKLDKDPATRGAPIGGVLVNVLEKPKRYVPKRKCKNCKELQEFATYIPTSTGEYACPMCGVKQTLTALKNDTPTIPPEYYQFLVTRNTDELRRGQDQIIKVGQEMLAMQKGGLYSHAWNQNSCVDFKWNETCAYFSHHKNATDTKEDIEFMDVPEYRGLVEIQQ